MKTSSAPRSSSVKPLQERSTSALWEMSPSALTKETGKKNGNTKYIMNIDEKINSIVSLSCNGACMYILFGTQIGEKPDIYFGLYKKQQTKAL